MNERKDDTDESTSDLDAQIELNLRIIREVSEAMTELPILARLEFAKNVMFNRDGDNPPRAGHATRRRRSRACRSSAP
jgi:hypothetical protein